MHDALEAFLGLWGDPTEAEVGLWQDVLAPFEAHVRPVLVEWLRGSKTKPHPHDLVKLAVDHAASGPMRSIADAVVAQYGLTLAEMRGPSQRPAISHPRQHVMAALREAGYSMAQIGSFLRRDHSTVVHGLRSHAMRTGGRTEPAAKKMR